jgi:hypothetical protein
VTFDEIRAHALSLPGVEEATSYGTPAFRVRKRLIARMHDEEDALVVKVDPQEREALLATQPDAFFITAHYLYETSWILARLAEVDAGELRELITEAWRRLAPRRIVEAFDAGELS